jgi:hypothetical protein
MPLNQFIRPTNRCKGSKKYKPTKNMKKIYLYFYGSEIWYFTTPKKAFEAAKSKNEQMHKTFAVFKRWLDQDGKYQFNYTTNEIQTRYINVNP